MSHLKHTEIFALETRLGWTLWVFFSADYVYFSLFFAPWLHYFSFPLFLHLKQLCSQIVVPASRNIFLDSLWFFSHHLFFPGNISRNCTAAGWSEVFPNISSVCGLDTRQEKVASLPFGFTPFLNSHQS